jgi:hypothetical protein
LTPEVALVPHGKADPKMREERYRPDFLFCPKHFISYSRIRYMEDQRGIPTGCPLCIRERNEALKTAEKLKKKKR